MIYREVDILAGQTVADSGTKTIDLDVTEPITELEALIGVTNGASENDDKTPQTIVSKIEIVDGGTVYSSLSGQEACGVFFYDAGKYPPHWYSEAASEGQSVTIPIHFGRFLGDPDYNFNPAALRNPQLKVTWNKDSAHLTNTVTLGVRAKVLTDQAAASQCIFTKSVRSFTSASSGDEPTDLPTDYPIRRLLIRPYSTGEVPASIITNFKLDCDQGKLVVFNISGWGLCEEVEKTFGYAHVRRTLVLDNDDYTETWIGNCFAGSGACKDGGYLVNLWCSGNPKAWSHVVSHAGTGGSDVEVEALFYGALPENIFAYQFGRPDDPATWFPAPSFRNVKLILKQGIASADVSILVQQVRGY